MRRRLALLVAGALVLAACSDDGADDAAEEPTSPTSPPSASSPTPTDGSSRDRPSPDRGRPFDPGSVLDDIRRLSTGIGPREATSPRFRRAARTVADRLDSLGYDVRRTRVPVPAGDSWGVPVQPGASLNVVADPPDLDPSGPYRIVGAHLDSVAVSPGAEDNASGVAVLLELARLAADRAPDVPVRFIAFGAEEPRGIGDDMHHFGSRQYVRELATPERRNLDAMVSLDRVGVAAPAVPVCAAGDSGTGVRRALLRAARAADVPASSCDDRASDHWSFEKAGLPAARIGSVPYAGYHSQEDLPRMVDRRTLHRVGRIMVRWLRAG